MILYFPSVKIVRCDLVPSQTGLVYLFYFKSLLNSPKHYPEHPLIEGKIEFADKIGFEEYFKFWFNQIFNDNNHKNLKGKVISVLVNFDSSIDKKFTLLGVGKKDDFAYFFFNKSMEICSEEMKAKLDYSLKKSSIVEKKKTKI